MTNGITTDAPVNLTIDKLKAWAKKNRRLAMTAIKARAFAEVERERVDAYIAPIFARYGFTDDLGGTGSTLTDPDKLYLSNDEERIAAYYAECDVSHRDHGFTGEPGTCPALAAEDLQRRAENLLLESLAELMGGGGFYTLELRAKALDIALGSCFAKEGK